MARVSAVDAVLFDLDDTLYPERAFVESGFRAVAKWLERRFGWAAGDLAREMEGLHQRYGRGHIFDRLLAYHHVDPTPTIVASLVTIYRSHRAHISPYPDVVPTLDALRRSGTRLGLVTDGLASVQRGKVRALRISRLLAVLVFSDEVDRNRPKPDPLPFRVALELMRVPAARAVYVGNDAAKDFTGARSVGMGTVRVRHGPRFGLVAGSDEDEADIFLERFESLPDVVGSVAFGGR
jgi:putative hydrolase of the HAD superfamily